MLIDIVFALIKDDDDQLMMLLQDLDRLVPFHGDAEDDGECLFGCSRLCSGQSHY
jgi:hypothetical protein